MVTAEPVRAKRRNAFGKPDAGDPHVRFDEGGGTSNDAPPLLDCPCVFNVDVVVYGGLSRRFLLTEFITKSGRISCDKISCYKVC